MFIDTANQQEVELINELGIIRGMTTNPTLLRKEGKKRTVQIKALLGVSKLPIFVQTVGSTEKDILTDVSQIIGFGESERIGVKIPINLVGITVIKQIKEMYPKILILGTAIYSADQGILAALAGCDYIAPYFNRMLVNGIDAVRAIQQMSVYIKEHHLACQIMGASFKNCEQVLTTLEAGADTVTVSYDILTQMLEKRLTNQDIESFNEDARLTEM